MGGLTRPSCDGSPPTYLYRRSGRNAAGILPGLLIATVLPGQSSDLEGWNLQEFSLCIPRDPCNLAVAQDGNAAQPPGDHFQKWTAIDRMQRRGSASDSRKLFVRQFQHGDALVLAR